jgi:hypothetical protein
MCSSVIGDIETLDEVSLDQWLSTWVTRGLSQVYEDNDNDDNLGDTVTSECDTKIHVMNN